MNKLLIISAVLIAIICCTGCTTPVPPIPSPCINGSGNIVTENRSVGEFIRIDMAVPAILTVRQGASPSLIIEGDDNILPLIVTNVQNGDLIISYSRPCMRPSSPVLIQATMQDIQGLILLGSGEINSSGTLAVNHLDTQLVGSGKMDLAVNATTLNTTITGSGNEQLNGKVVTHQIRIPGSGSVHAFELNTDTTRIEIIGSGNADVNANSALIIQITGSGSVQYTGSVSDIQQSITGSGSVKRVY
jgi:hypothetical protein